MTVPCASVLHATAASGFSGVTLVMGTFGEIDVFNKVIPPDFWKNWINSDVWLSWQKTKGRSDLYIQSNTWHSSGPQPAV